MRSLLLTLAVILIIPAHTLASEPLFSPPLKNVQPVGSAHFQFMFVDIYDATLYAPKNGWSFSSPFALELKYLRNLSGKKIADRSAKEIRQQGFNDEIKLADWHSQMTSIFPDVQNGTILTGVYTPESETVFYKDQKIIGKINDPAFGKWFFGIWLSEKTSEPQFRKSLLEKKNL